MNKDKEKLDQAVFLNPKLYLPITDPTLGQFVPTTD